MEWLQEVGEHAIPILLFYAFLCFMYNKIKKNFDYPLIITIMMLVMSVIICTNLGFIK